MLPFSLADGWSANNPWARFFGLSWPRSFRRADELMIVLVYASMILAVACLAGSVWIPLGGKPTPAILDRYGGLVYGFTVMFALLSPAMGAAVRARIDQSPVFPETVCTPLPAGFYVAAMHARVLGVSVLAGTAVLAMFLPVMAIWLGGDTGLRGGLVSSSLRLYLLQLEPPSDWSPGLVSGIVPMLAALLVVGTSFGAGIHLRAGLVALVPQRASGSRMRGGVVTFIAVFLVFLSVPLRLNLIGLASGFLETAGWPNPGWAILTIELPLLLGRIAATMFVWRKIATRFGADLEQGVGE